MITNVIHDGGSNMRTGTKTEHSIQESQWSNNHSIECFFVIDLKPYNSFQETFGTEIVKARNASENVSKGYIIWNKEDYPKLLRLSRQENSIFES